MDDRLEVIHRPELARWEAHVGDRSAGILAYREADGRFVLEHTEVDTAFEGRGIGSMLARTALVDVRAVGGRVVVECPFVRSWLRRHREFDDIIDRR